MIVYEFLRPHEGEYRFGVVLNGNFYLLGCGHPGIFKGLGPSQDVINTQINVEDYIPRKWKYTPDTVRQEIVKLAELLSMN